MSFLTDQIASLAATTLVPTTSVPSDDQGFGTDLSCTDDLTSDMAEIPGNSTLVVAQSNYRRLTTPRGSLIDDPNYGIDINSFLGSGLTDTLLQQIPGQVAAELKKDDRNETVEVSFRQTGSVSFDLDVKGTTADGPYTLTFAIVDGEAALKEINADA